MTIVWYALKACGIIISVFLLENLQSVVITMAKYAFCLVYVDTMISKDIEFAGE